MLVYYWTTVIDAGPTLNPGLFNLNFQSLEAVFRYRDTQLLVTENLCSL